MSIEDDAPSERPKEAVTDENIKKVHKIIFDNRKMKLIEIAETLKISKERVGHIVHEYLDMRKLCSKWVLSELTIDQNNNESMILRSVWSCSIVINPNFCVDI